MTLADPGVFLDRFATPVFLVMVVLRVVAVLVSELVSGGEFTEGMVIIGTVVVVSAIGYYKREAIRDLVGSLRERAPF